MKCFYHHSVDSIGVCRSCGRGLCPDCVTEYPEGLACKDRCETAVEETIALVKRNRTAPSKLGLTKYLFPIILIAIGTTQLYQGIFEEKTSLNSLTIIGAVFFVGGILYLGLIRRFYRD